MKHSITFAADGTAYLATVVRRHADATDFVATVSYSGTFGSGTVKLQWSPDGGTTKIDIPSSSSTSATVIGLGPLGNATKNGDEPLIYAVLTGSTNPSLVVTMFDNR